MRIPLRFRRLACGVVAVTSGYFLVEPKPVTFLYGPVVKIGVTSHETALLAGLIVGALTWATLALAIYCYLLLLDRRLRSH